MKLYKNRVKWKIWRILVDAYCNMTCEIVANEQHSESFVLRQDDVLLSLLYITHIDGLLAELENSGNGAKVFSLNC